MFASLSVRTSSCQTVGLLYAWTASHFIGMYVCYEKVILLILSLFVYLIIFVENNLPPPTRIDPHSTLLSLKLSSSLLPAPNIPTHILQWILNTSHPFPALSRHSHTFRGFI